jgi:hypothetical protein
LHPEQGRICTYHHVEQKNKENAAGVVAIDDENPTTTNTASHVATGATKQELLYSEIDRLMKNFKAHHRCALYFDLGFVNSELKEVKKNDDANEMVTNVE